MCRHRTGFQCLMSAKMHATVRCYLYEEQHQQSGGKPCHILSSLDLTPTGEDTGKCEGPGFSFLLGKRILTLQACQAHAETENAVILSSPPAYEICIHSNLTGSSPLTWCPHFTQLQNYLDSELPNNETIWMLIGTKEKSQVWILKAVSEPPIPWQFSAP